MKRYRFAFVGGIRHFAERRAMPRQNSLTMTYDVVAMVNHRMRSRIITTTATHLIEALSEDLGEGGVFWLNETQ